MINSISLSSDMSKLLFTNPDGTTEIELTGNGAAIYVENGKITAGPSNEPFLGIGFEEPCNDSQWTLTFNEIHQTSYFIGVTDLDTNLQGKFHQFNMTGKVLNIRCNNSSLTVVSIPA